MRIVALCLLLAVTATAGCNTVKGAAKDLNSVAEAVERAVSN